MAESPRKPSASQLQRSLTGKTALSERKWAVWAGGEVNCDKGMGIWAHMSVGETSFAAPTQKLGWLVAKRSRLEAGPLRSGARAASVDKGTLQTPWCREGGRGFPRPRGLRRWAYPGSAGGGEDP